MGRGEVRGREMGETEMEGSKVGDDSSGRL